MPVVTFWVPVSLEQMEENKGVADVISDIRQSRAGEQDTYILFRISAGNFKKGKHLSFKRAFPMAHEE